MLGACPAPENLPETLGPGASPPPPYWAWGWGRAASVGRLGARDPDGEALQGLVGEALFRLDLPLQNLRFSLDTQPRIFLLLDNVEASPE